jgi:hypothetical protein
VAAVGIEGTSSHGVGITAAVGALGVRVVEINRTRPAERRKQARPTGWMRTARPGRCSPARPPPTRRTRASNRCGRSNVAGRSAVKARPVAWRQILAHLVNATHIRDRYRDLPDANLTATLASTRPDRLGDNDAAGTMSALSALARRHQSLEMETAELEERMSARATVASPSAETRPRPRGRPRPGRALRRPRLLRPAARPPSQVTRPHRRGRAPRGVARPDRGTRAQKPPQRRTRHPLPRLAQRRLTRLTRSRSMSPAIGPEGTCERAVGREAFAIGSPALLGGTFRSCAG